MNFAKEIVGTGILLPAAVSLVICVVLRRVSTADLSERYASSIAFVAGFCAGYALLPAWAELVPKRHWQWMFYLAPFAAVIGPIAASRGLFIVERWLLQLTAAFAAAWLLTPTWDTLVPPRPVWIAVLTGYFFLLSALFEPLAGRWSSRTFLALVVLTSAWSAASITVSVSVTYGRPAGIAAAALVGCSIAAFVSRGRTSTRGLSLAYAIVVGGWAFVGCIDPQQPLFALMLAPLAPLALWSCAYGPLARLRGLATIAAQTAAVIVILAISAGLLMTSLAGANTDAW